MTESPTEPIPTPDHPEAHDPSLDTRSKYPRDEKYRRRERQIELVAAIILAVATILTAWSAFEASKWGGAMSISFANSNRQRIDANRAFGSGETLAQIDVSVFESWVEAEGAGNLELASFYESRFRDDFRPAFDKWIASEPLKNPEAANSPFALPEYDLPEFERADQLDKQANESSEEARTNNQRGDNYTLTTVLFASVLFFAGISTKFESLRAKYITLGAGIVVLVLGGVIIATFPVLI